MTTSRTTKPPTVLITTLAELLDNPCRKPFRLQFRDSGNITLGRYNDLLDRHERWADEFPGSVAFAEMFADCLNRDAGLRPRLTGVAARAAGARRNLITPLMSHPVPPSAFFCEICGQPSCVFRGLTP